MYSKFDEIKIVGLFFAFSVMLSNPQLFVFLKTLVFEDVLTVNSGKPLLIPS